MTSIVQQMTKTATRAAVVIATILIAASCSTSEGHRATGGSQTPGAALPRPRSTLTCADELGPTVPPGDADLRVDGLALEGLRAAARRKVSSLSVVANGRLRFRFLKVVLYVMPQASAETTLTVAAPASARLYYTDATTWTSGPTASQVLADSRKSVTVEPCAGFVAGYAGGFLLRAAGCVTLRIQGNSDRSVTVPIGVPGCAERQ